MPTPLNRDDLAKLPLRALVAFAARCARRVFPLYHSAPDARSSDSGLLQIDSAIRNAELFASGNDKEFDPTASDIAANIGQRAEEHAHEAVAFAAAYACQAAFHASFHPYDSIADAEHAAQNALEASRDELVDAAATMDYEKLLALGLGDFPEYGTLVDLSEQGPLGPLWPDRTPDWYEHAKRELDLLLASSRAQPLISVHFDDSGFTPDEMATFLAYISETYRSLDGSGLTIVRGQAFAPSWEVVS